MVKKNVYFFHIGYILIPSSKNIHISRCHLRKEFNLGPQKLCLYKLTRINSAEILLHISSDLRDLSVIFEEMFYLVVTPRQIKTLQVL